MSAKILKAVIVDDERPSREVLRNYIEEYCDGVKVTATAGSVETGIKAIKKHKPDVVFLDIELGDGKGFDILSHFRKDEFKVIFVTAYSEYAVKAFRFSAVDYLLKPVRIDELKEAVGKVRNINGTSVSSENIEILSGHIQGKTAQDERLVISDLKGYEILRLSEIIMCRADGYCTCFVLSGGRKVVSSKNLKYYEDLMADYGFIRVHNSYLVNINQVTGYTRQGEIILKEGNRAFLGNTYKDSFISMLHGRAR